MSSRQTRCGEGRGGRCLFPLRDPERATEKAVGILQRNLGRRLSLGDLTYLKHSEIWHEFRYRVVRGQPLALDWAYVDEGPTSPGGLERSLVDALIVYHLPKEEPDVRRPVTEETVSATPSPHDRIRAARRAREAEWDGV